MKKELVAAKVTVDKGSHSTTITVRCSQVVESDSGRWLWLRDKDGQAIGGYPTEALRAVEFLYQ